MRSFIILIIFWMVSIIELLVILEDIFGNGSGKAHLPVFSFPDSLIM